MDAYSKHLVLSIVQDMQKLLDKEENKKLKKYLAFKSYSLLGVKAQIFLYTHKEYTYTFSEYPDELLDIIGFYKKMLKHVFEYCANNSLKTDFIHNVNNAILYYLLNIKKYGNFKFNELIKGEFR